ncbi:hypothetical protein ACERK3_16925 [Phycisphaerales bacterium AB-hyl4]|uniref:Uncharacterized protein n=1 Tax=Natronomicrosphaera hydrolytica TaxID=3242702 RepID=A0ABV4UAY5_9BACT
MSTDDTGVQPNICGGPADAGHLPPPTHPARHYLMLTSYGPTGPKPSGCTCYWWSDQQKRWLYQGEFKGENAR